MNSYGMDRKQEGVRHGLATMAIRMLKHVHSLRVVNHASFITWAMENKRVELTSEGQYPAEVEI